MKRLDANHIKQIADVVDILHKLGHPQAQYRRAFRCPFGTHEDKHPSCHCERKRQICSCFACGTTGLDVFALVQRLENLDFPQAVRRVAELYNYPVD